MYKRRPMNRRREAEVQPRKRTHHGLPPDVFEHIVQTVTMQAAADRYGLVPNKHGLCCCPFHGEKTPSFKIYPGSKGFYCFGCGVGGDVITFAEKLLGLSPAEAVKRLDADFGLGLFGQTSAPSSNDWQRRKAQRESAEADREDALWKISNLLRGIYNLPKPIPGAYRYAALYALDQANAEYLEYRKEEILQKGG